MTASTTSGFATKESAEKAPPVRPASALPGMLSGLAPDQVPPFWVGFENLSREHGFVPLRVEGKLPPELRGSFYRNGPVLFDTAGERYQHWFDGDGGVAGVRLDGKGGALGAATTIRTKWRERERRAGKRLFGAFDTPLVRPLREVFLKDRKNAANTSVLVHDERLYALCEGGKPFEISTEDLSTLGERDFDGIVTEAFSAHPHRSPSRKATYGFGLAVSRNTTVECYSLPDGGKKERLTSFKIDGLRMCHDFAVTERHLVFFFTPVYFSLWGLLRGRGMMSSAKWRPERGTEVVIVPIDAPHKLTRFTVPAFYMEHVANAFERPNGDIVVDYNHYNSVSDFEDFIGGIVKAMPKRPLECSLRRATIDMRRKSMRIEMVADEPFELPKVSPLVETKEHRYTYAAAFRGEMNPPRAIFKHDIQSGKLEFYEPGTEQYPTEALFIPRANPKAEDDGWLMMLVLDAKDRTTNLQVVDAARFDDGPVAKCHFEQVIPFGFHGIWQPARA